MKQKLFTLFLALVANVGMIYASNTSVGGIYYDFDSSTKTATVTYRGSDFYSYNNEYSGSVVIPSSVTYNGTTYSVTSIGNFAFYECSSLTSVTIPNSVTSIGDYAFEDCSKLTSITIPNSVTSIGKEAFRRCKSLTSITIPNSVTSIGYFAFGGCSSLTSIIIPNSVTSIGNLAFYGCSSLTSITIPNSVTSIGDDAFKDCSSLTSITIPNSVTSIGNYVFYNCSSLSSITIPNSVTSIGDDAFNGCKSLTSVTIGESVTSIGDYAFRDCSKLTSITIPNSVTSIGEYALYECSSLTSITFEGSTPPLFGKDVFANTNNFSIYVPCGTKDAYVAALNVYIDASRVISPAQYTIKVESADEIQGTVGVELVSTVGKEKDSIYYTSSDGNIVTPYYSATVFGANIVSNTYQDGQGVMIFDRSVTSIGDDAFEGCTGLTSVTIPNSVTSIGDDAFYECSSLTSVTIPNSVTSIGWGAFEDCSSLTSITIPNSVTSIGNYVFYNCSSLTSINVDSNNPNYTSVDGVLFNKDKTTLIQYPEGKQGGAYTIPNSVTSIGYCAFASCSSLTSITIPNSVTSIGDYAFEDCSSLISVTFKGLTPPTIAKYVFNNTNNCPIYVPYGTKDAYVTALNVNNTIDASRVIEK